jgi:hypothetical protein
MSNAANNASLTVTQLLAIARSHIGNGAAMDSSARLCLADAVRLADNGDFVNARNRAVTALKYSVGVFHSDYQLATKG